MEPRAIVVADNLILLSRVTTQLAQMNYAVRDLRDAAELPAAARDWQPLFAVLDLATKRGDSCGVIAQLKADPALKHVPVLAFCDHTDTALLDRAREAGAELVTSNGAVAQHLPALVQQLLAV